MTKKTSGQFLVTTPPAWTFEDKSSEDEKVGKLDQWKQLEWVRFSDLRICVDAVRKHKGHFSLPNAPHHPLLFTSFGHLLADRVYRDPDIRYTFLEPDAGRFHLNVAFCHDNVDEIFVPSWDKVIQYAVLVRKGKKLEIEYRITSSQVCWNKKVRVMLAPK